ncbi:MAG: CinA family nicotinamide mononucleotide deamidase-related protein [Anaerolineales bacterium]
MPTAEIITIGTEILLGEIVDTNTRYIARALRGLGVDLYRTITIGDNVERIAEAIRQSMQRADIVITTGGLGPTIDDPTREAVALAFDVETEFRPELWEQILAIITRYGRVPSDNQKRQAYVPAGAVGLQNPVGTAPAFIMEFTAPLPSGEGPGVKAGSVISLPGVPKEMEYLLGEAVIPYLQKRYHLDQIIKVRLLHTAGAPEADVDEKIGDFETLANPTVGLAAHTGIVDIRIAAKAATNAEADRMIADVEAQIRARLGSAVFGADDDTLEGAALRAASDRTWNLVAAEAGLGGALKRRLANAGAQNLLAVESADLKPGELFTFLKALREKYHARAALGIAAFPETQTIELVLLTPEESKERQLPFGGHPALLARWAVNLALNWLRRTAEKSTS